MYESYEEMRSKFLPIDGVLGSAHGRGQAQIGEKDNGLFCFLCEESIRSGKAEAHLSDPKHEAKVTAGEAEVQEEVRLEEEAALAKAAEAEAAAAPSEESAPMETEVAANGAVNGK